MIKRTSLKFSFLILVAILFPTSFAHVQAVQSSNTPLPTIDGFWSPGEWPASSIHTYQFLNLKTVQFAYRYNATDLFMTARYQDNTPSFYGKTCQSILFKVCSDAFAVGFDRNGDGSFMGTPSSPDDAVFVGMMGNYSIDAYMQGIGHKVVFDTEVGGQNNTSGRYSYNYTTHYFTFEMTKKLDSGDTKGYDISLHPGQSINVMLAYWNNLPPRTEISSYTNWITIRIDVGYSLIDYISPIVIAFIIALAVIVIKIRFS